MDGGGTSSPRTLLAFHSQMVADWFFNYSCELLKINWELITIPWELLKDPWGLLKTPREPLKKMEISKNVVQKF